jgi:hypothetical protein
MIYRNYIELSKGDTEYFCCVEGIAIIEKEHNVVKEAFYMNILYKNGVEKVMCYYDKKSRDEDYEKLKDAIDRVTTTRAFP